jgi:hypothetical protein
MLVVAWTMASCSHYSYVDQGASTTAVSVWTVASPADEGLDQPRLTRTLVGAMRQHGVDASWQDDPTGPSVRCSVSSTEVDGFGQSIFARAQVACRVESPDNPADHERFEASGRYAGSIGGQVAGLAPSHAALQEAAAADALERVADQIAQFMLQT